MTDADDAGKGNPGEGGAGADGRRRRRRGRRGPEYRAGLAAIDGQRMRFTARIGRRGSKSGWTGYPVATILLLDVCDFDTGRSLTGHLWITAGKWADGLLDGDLIAFDARVDAYVKGYQGRRDDVVSDVSVDYHLERPTKLAVQDSAGDWVLRAGRRRA